MKDPFTPAVRELAGYMERRYGSEREASRVLQVCQGFLALVEQVDAGKGGEEALAVSFDLTVQEIERLRFVRTDGGALAWATDPELYRLREAALLALPSLEEYL